MGINDQEEFVSNTDTEGKIGQSCTLDLFKENDDIQKMILSIPNDTKIFVIAEKKFEDFKTILDYYQEQPHLLDPYLENFLKLLVNIIRDNKSDKEELSQAFKYLWLIVKVRGYKYIVKILPHEVKDLLPVLQLLEQQNVDDNFYGSYVLLMWLSIIILMPFNIKRFDDTAIYKEDDKNQIKSVIDRILDAIKIYLEAPHSSREVAAYLASKFVTRPDLKEVYLPQFIDYCFKVANIEDETNRKDLFNKMGVIRSLGLIFKHGKREELLPYCNDVLTRFVDSYAFKKEIRPLRKLSIKLVQRVGLAFLKPRVATWRYQRGSRSLETNIKGAETTVVNTDAKEIVDEDNDEVVVEIEDIIEILLQGLRESDTVVRWSAAKGLGRVTSRLPRGMADEVTGATLDLFSIKENDKAWHGGCLALAELARRGLFLPERLADVMPVLEKALVYDELRGQSSVGSNIRDAACYLCWAFARAYHPSQISPYVQQLAKGLLIVSLFDREIPCRRAGSAAFQEHVGRQGTFPHGIDILTTVDYFAVGNRVNAYLSLSEHVGKYPEYTIALIDHLHTKKVEHWDSVVRDLAAKALGKLTHFAPEYVNAEKLPALLESSVGKILIVRHGSILAAAYIIYALFQLETEEGKRNYEFSSEIISKICHIVPELEDRKLFRGMGGQYMRQATSVLIEKCSKAKLPISEQNDILKQWCLLLEDSLTDVDENIRNASLEALPVFYQQYFLSSEQYTFRQETVAKYIKGLSSDDIRSIGYASALGCLPKKFFEGTFNQVLKALLNATKITPETISWAHTRKEAINSIIKLNVTVGVTGKSGTDGFCEDNIKMLFDGLVLAMQDYTMDRRGDVGAWVREAAMNALKVMCKAIVEVDVDMLDQDVVRSIIQHVSQQCVERIDRTRKLAGSVFYELLHGNPKIPHVPEQEKLLEIFPIEWCNKCNWASESYTLQNFALLMDLPVYRSQILLGLTYSLGGGSANLSRYSCEALRLYLNSRTGEQKMLKDFMEAVIQLFVNHQRKDRITQPLLKSLAELFSCCNALDQVLEEEEILSRFIICLRQECNKCTDFHKLSSVVTILCELLRIESSVTKNILTYLSIFLGYQYPKVRALAATSLLTALQEYNDRIIVPEEVTDEVCDILEDTLWLDNIEEARNKRNQLCALIGINPPQAKKKI